MNLIVLLQMALALLANPQVQANPVYLQEATLIAHTAVVLAEQGTAVQAQSNPVPLVPNQDTSANPEGVISIPNQPLGASEPIASTTFSGTCTLSVINDTSTASFASAWIGAAAIPGTLDFTYSATGGSDAGQDNGILLYSNNGAFTKLGGHVFQYAQNQEVKIPVDLFKWGNEDWELSYPDGTVCTSTPNGS